MKRLILLVAILLTAAGVALAGQPFYTTTVSATQTNTTVDLKTNLGQDVHSLLVINDGANEIFINIQTGVATTADFRIEPTDAPYIFTSGGGEFALNTIGIICSSGETASVRLLALPSK